MKTGFPKCYLFYNYAGLSRDQGIPVPLVVGGGGQRYHYEPSTSTLITRSPLVRDPYEQRYVYVKESGLPMAGEGLYAKTNIKKVSLLIIKIYFYLFAAQQQCYFFHQWL